MNEFLYYNTAVYRKELPHLVDSTTNCIRDFINRQRGLQQKDQLSVNKIQTDVLQYEPELEKIHNYFLEASINILENQGYNTSLYNFYPISWAQSLAFPTYHDFHIHPQTAITALYFLQTPENGSVPVFEDPRPGKNITDLECYETTDIKHSTREIHFVPIPGTMLLFNSWLPHRLSQNQSEIPTMFVHMCLQYQRKM